MIYVRVTCDFIIRYYNLYLDEDDKSPRCKLDASFNVRYGLAANKKTFGISFESVNMPGYYITDVNGRPMISRRVHLKAYDLRATWMPITAQISHKTVPNTNARQKPDKTGPPAKGSEHKKIHKPIKKQNQRPNEGLLSYQYLLTTF